MVSTALDHLGGPWSRLRSTTLVGARPLPTRLPRPPGPGDTAGVAYDEDLANRIRETLSGETAITERRMFGGLAFLAGGHLALAASGQGGVMVRVDPADAATLVAKPHVGPMVMRGRTTRGWLRVAAEGVRTSRQLEPWVARGVACARSLPPKR